MRSFAVLLSFVASTLAYFVDFPNNSSGWTNEGAQTLNWHRVDTDPLQFAVALDNQNLQGFQISIIEAEVDGTTGSIQISPPSGGWPTGLGYRVNLLRSSEHFYDILAQSEEFKIAIV